MPRSERALPRRRPAHGIQVGGVFRREADPGLPAIYYNVLDGHPPEIPPPLIQVAIAPDAAVDRER